MKNILLWSLGSIGAIQGINKLPTPDLIGEIFKILMQIVIAIISLIKIFQHSKNLKK